jgi:hypothetical protein
VSFRVDVELPHMTWDEADRLTLALLDRGGFRVFTGWRGRWLRAPYPRINFDEKIHDVIADEADWDESAFTLDPDGRERLARTIEVLGALLPAGWSLRAYWEGDHEDREEQVSAAALADLTRDCALERRIRYRVAR